MRRYGRIPLLLGLAPFNRTEDSLTYFYGVETLALFAQALQRAKQDGRT
jgi:hypothetical protein